VHAPRHQPEEHGDSQGVPRFHKLSFPTYDDKEDPLGWLNHCESFFRGQLTREADKVWLASFHMTGSAQHFGPALSTNHLADLARLPFGASVDAYMEAFQARLAHAGHLAPLQQAQLFTGGLPEYIWVDVELHDLQLQDLHRAMRLAGLMSVAMHQRPSRSQHHPVVLLGVLRLDRPPYHRQGALRRHQQPRRPPQATPSSVSRR